MGHPREEGDEISLEPLRPRTFDKTSPVTAYWLPRCDGFEVVGGRRSAVVESAVFDDDPLHPVALRIRQGHKRRRLIPIDAVEAVSPLRRVLYVRRRRSVAKRAGSGVATVGAGTRRAARRVGIRSAALWRFSASRVRIAALAALATARAQWPSVRRGAVVAGETAFFTLLVTATMVASASIAGARLLRAGFLVTRRYAPRGARAAQTSFTQAQRVVTDRARKTALATGIRPVADRGGAKLLERPLGADVVRMHEQHESPHEPKGVARGQVLH